VFGFVTGAQFPKSLYTVVHDMQLLYGAKYTILGINVIFALPGARMYSPLEQQA
jgi:hypothetical protein